MARLALIVVLVYSSFVCAYPLDSSQTNAQTEGQKQTSAQLPNSHFPSNSLTTAAQDDQETPQFSVDSFTPNNQNNQQSQNFPVNSFTPSQNGQQSSTFPVNDFTGSGQPGKVSNPSGNHKTGTSSTIQFQPISGAAPQQQGGSHFVVAQEPGQTSQMPQQTFSQFSSSQQPQHQQQFSQFGIPSQAIGVPSYGVMPSSPYNGYTPSVMPAVPNMYSTQYQQYPPPGYMVVAPTHDFSYGTIPSYAGYGTQVQYELPQTGYGVPQNYGYQGYSSPGYTNQGQGHVIPYTHPQSVH